MGICGCIRYCVHTFFTYGACLTHVPFATLNRTYVRRRTVTGGALAFTTGQYEKRFTDLLRRFVHARYVSRMERTTGQSFAQWLREQLEARGYDLGIRGGGQTRFAADSGISRPTVSRLLSGTAGHDVRSMQLLAEALRVPLGEILVRAGILDATELAAVATPEPGARRITPEQAADELGIKDEQARALFVSMTHTLQRPPGGNRAAN